MSFHDPHEAALAACGWLRRLHFAVFVARFGPLAGEWRKRAIADALRGLSTTVADLRALYNPHVSPAMPVRIGEIEAADPLTATMKLGTHVLFAGPNMMRWDEYLPSKQADIESLLFAGADAQAIKRLEVEIEVHRRAMLQRPPGQPEAKQTKRKAKKAKEETDSEALIIAALAEHHGYGKESLYLEPARVRELARKTKVSPSVVSAFFQKHFGGHAQYRRACQDEDGLQKVLELLQEGRPPVKTLLKARMDHYASPPENPDPDT